ncbi:MAG: hypothetical protein CM15mP74_35810 [Halieaceae bacterium]|nr:MAG: hypothetical protein CM15mP74_35810 [Halieaceae bacterium]
MVYGVYSEGFRVGGVNRGRCNTNGCGTWPLVYDSDTLENVEFGSSLSLQMAGSCSTPSTTI